MATRICGLMALLLLASCDPLMVDDRCGENQCDDGDECTVDICIERQCAHFTLGESSTGDCLRPCYTNSDCDDGRFCTGYDFCREGVCWTGPMPCADGGGLTICSEEQDRCFQCVQDSDCSPGQSCTSGLCVGNCPLPCGSEDLCIRSHCVGANSCQSDDVSCGAGQRCDPATGSCVAVGHLCLSQCQITDRTCCAIDSPGCAALPLESFADYSTMLLQWRNLPCDGYPENFAVAGTCEDGSLALRGSINLFPVHTVLFSPAGEFQAIMTDLGHDLPENCRGHAYWPAEPTCKLVTVTEVICGARYQVGDVANFDVCRSQCEITGCPEEPIQSFPDFENTIEEWTESFCGYEITSLHVGSCDEQTQFIYLGYGLGFEVRYFDAATAQFLAKNLQTDLGDSACCGETYWPVRIPCDNAVISEVICGFGQVGGHVPVSYADSCHPLP